MLGERRNFSTNVILLHALGPLTGWHLKQQLRRAFDDRAVHGIAEAVTVLRTLRLTRC